MNMANVHASNITHPVIIQSIRNIKSSLAIPPESFHTKCLVKTFQGILSRLTGRKTYTNRGGKRKVNSNFMLFTRQTNLRWLIPLNLSHVYPLFANLNECVCHIEKQYNNFINCQALSRYPENA